MQLINTDTNFNPLREPIFFGRGLSIQRYDIAKYPIILSMFEKQVSVFWRPEEVDLAGKDRNDFKTLTDNEKKIFTDNLSYQILLDSAQSRGISHLMADCSNSEVEAFAKSWEFMETIHSYSYTHIIRNLYPSPGDVFDNIMHNDEIRKRTTSVTKYYDDLINKIPEDSLHERKKKLYLTLFSINILEGIRFYVSFACSYAFAENQKMEGNAKIISLINRDENLHLGFSQYVLKKLREEESEGFFEVVAECEEVVRDMYRDAAKEEMEWAEYLFKDGAILGLNAEILKLYMMYLTNNRMKTVGLTPIFEKTKNPINWINSWTTSKDVQPAPQETEIESYINGSFEQDLDATDYSQFSDF